MCLSIPGKIIEINQDKIIVDYDFEKRTISNSLVDIKEGDYVIVQNEIIVAKLNKEKAEKFLELIKNDS